MDLKERISNLFSGETDATKLKEVATCLNELEELNKAMAKQKEDNIELSKAYIDAIKGAIKKNPPIENPNDVPGKSKEISLDDAFKSALGEFEKENKEN